MEWVWSAVADASTGAAAGAAQPVIDYILGIVFLIVGAVLILALVFKGVEALADGHVGRFISFLALFLLVSVIIGSSRQIATQVTAFAGGAALEPERNDHLVSAVVGMLLGDLLWWTCALACWFPLYGWMVSRKERPDGHPW
jgi:hypothetical protein